MELEQIHAGKSQSQSFKLLVGFKLFSTKTKTYSEKNFQPYFKSEKTVTTKVNGHWSKQTVIRFDVDGHKR